MLAYILIAVTLEIIIALTGILFFFIGFRAIKKNTHYLVSFATGTFLGLVFFDLLPETMERTSIEQGSLYIFGGFIIFFLLSHLMLWYHHHEDETCCDTHTQLNGTNILLADVIHNFIDGIIITTAFLVDIRLGILTTIAVLLHEFPQEVADFFVLINSGFSRTKALFSNFLISTSTLFGALTAYFFLSSTSQVIGPLLGIATGNVLYLAASDLVPTLHSYHRKGANTIIQLTLLFIGIAIMYIVELFK